MFIIINWDDQSIVATEKDGIKRILLFETVQEVIDYATIDKIETYQYVNADEVASSELRYLFEKFF